MTQLINSDKQNTTQQREHIHTFLNTRYNFIKLILK